MRHALRWTIVLAGVLSVVCATVAPAHAQRPSTRRAVAMYLEESNDLARRVLEMLTTAWEKPDVKRALDVHVEAYLKLNGALARCQVMQEKAKMPDPMLGLVVRNLQEARESMRGAHSHIREATGVGSENTRAQHLTSAAALIRRSIGLNEQSAAFL